MSRRNWSQRIVLAAAALALLLKAAVPMVAAGAAQWRDVSVADVCPMYGVDMAAMAMPSAQPTGDATRQATSTVDGGHADSDHHGKGTHDERSADSCALCALATLATPDGDLATLPAPRPAVASPALMYGGVVHDACALWTARRKQGPPTA